MYVYLCAYVKYRSNWNEQWALQKKLMPTPHQHTLNYIVCDKKDWMESLQQQQQK